MVQTLVIVALTAVIVTFVTWIARAYQKQRGTRAITCPETLTPEGVQVDAGHAAVTALMGHPDLRLSDCTRWPERAACGQECLSQVRAAPHGCLVRNIVAEWYAGKTCALCHRPVGEREWMEHEPALMDPRNRPLRTVALSDLHAQHLWRALETHVPVCWNCHVSETFRREHPELVIDRPA
jgi:hypothetical protein